MSVTKLKKCPINERLLWTAYHFWHLTHSTFIQTTKCPVLKTAKNCIAAIKTRKLKYGDVT